MIDQLIPVRKKPQHFEADLHAAGIYPPGGDATAMIETPELRWQPPDYLVGTALDSYEDHLTFAQGAKLPPSVSAVQLDRIRTRKARPDKRRVSGGRYE
jgi:hypothetical protein